jgi:hypothetical protein
MRDKWLLLALLLGEILAALALPSQAATVQVTSHIAFDRPGGVVTQENINFGDVDIPPNAGIRINAFGQIWLDGEGPIQTSDSQSGTIIFDGPVDQLLNFFSTNYHANNNVTPSKATCSVEGVRNGKKSSDSDCNRLYGIITQSKARLRLGIQALVTGNLEVLGPAYPSFDLYVVYQ